MKRKGSGFTLIELLIVIAIIAALAAILLPVFFSVRAKGRQTVCVSNLHQLSLGILQYAGDYDDHYPWGGDPTDLGTNSWQTSRYAPEIQQMKAQNAYLPNVMSAFVKDRELWHCPADTGLDIGGMAEDIPIEAHPSCFAVYGMSYAYTTLLVLQNQTVTGVRAWSKLPPYSEHDPAEIVVLSDSSGHWHGGDAQKDERRNLVMLDGHVITTSQDRALYLKRIVFDLPTANLR